MRRIVDFHIHSKYSRATSKNLDLNEIARWSRIKGIDVVSCADFTHPRWFAHIQESLREDGTGLLKHREAPAVKFILATEVSCIYRHRDATRRVHHLILAPTLDSVMRITRALESRGAKLASDGRPILGMSSKDLLTLVLEADSRNVLIPAHVWTPWFALFGSKSGYDSVQDCFEDLSPHIFALETGLSSDPAMNRMLSALDSYALVSNSDAHSGPKMGREANVLNMEEDTYDELVSILKENKSSRFLETIEFFPEEGMYHYDGHRLCGVSLEPRETKKHKGICPVCKKPLTIGVLHRVDNLKDRDSSLASKSAVPFRHIVPLPEIIADYYQTAGTSKKAVSLFQSIIAHGNSEFSVLLDLPPDSLKKIMPTSLASAIMRMRRGTVRVEPGYDGKYGIVSLFSDEHRSENSQGLLL